ncbi:MAG: hypothetical protein HQK54_18345 [Oligoflexales bacterium]|nr:hypothetical protein [Oligoflexales bacterium]
MIPLAPGKEPERAGKSRKEPERAGKRKRRKIIMATKDDPLVVIFEKRLKESDINDQGILIEEVLEEYFGYLRYLKVTVPSQIKPLVEEELRHQVKSMLSAKTYGCISLSDYRKKHQSEEEADTLRKKYNKLF